MSNSHCPTLPWALPLYDMMKNTLEANKTDDSLPCSLRQAANAGHTLLMKYYSLHATITSM